MHPPINGLLREMWNFKHHFSLRRKMVSPRLSSFSYRSQALAQPSALRTHSSLRHWLAYYRSHEADASRVASNHCYQTQVHELEVILRRLSYLLGSGFPPCFPRVTHRGAHRGGRRTDASRELQGPPTLRSLAKMEPHPHGHRCQQKAKSMRTGHGWL